MGAAALLGLSACGSSDDSTQPSSSTDAQSSDPRSTDEAGDNSGGSDADSGDAPSCPSASTASDTLGMDLGDAEANSSVEDVIVCTYTQQGGTAMVIVRMDSNSSREAFAVGRKGFEDQQQETVDLPGLFDEAFTSEIGSQTYGYTRTVVARKGAVEVLVTGPATYEAEQKLISAMID